MATTKGLGLDTYARRARLIPGLLAVLPMGLAIVAWFPEDIAAWGVVSGFIVAAGGTVLLAHIARILGKRIEAMLFANWGCSPAVLALRHSGSSNSAICARRHSQLARISPDIPVPTSTEELTDPNRADALYGAHIKVLIAKTRDRKRFPLLFEENCNYGFWRNLLGLRPIGVASSLVGLASLAYLVASGRSPITLTVVVGAAATFLLLLLWTFFINEGAIRPHADAYAERLLEACEELM